MTDIVERLRVIAECLKLDSEGFYIYANEVREAADEIERLTGETSHWMDEAARLQNMQANLHSHIKRLELELSATKAERTRAQQACEQIASKLDCHAGRDGE